MGRVDIVSRRNLVRSGLKRKGQYNGHALCNHEGVFILSGKKLFARSESPAISSIINFSSSRGQEGLDGDDLV